MTTQTPVTEIVTLSLTPTADVAALANTLHTIISRQPGSLETKWGVWEEDRTKLQLMTSKSPPFLFFPFMLCCVVCSLFCHSALYKS
ncbi:hypothetical protein BJX61DRAFT_517660 [Aspergillus egyptiacus]|nr:hypothetical protein BJX61DRAFT_517660 [Aspergillus egyptiacus]